MKGGRWWRGESEAENSYFWPMRPRIADAAPPPRVGRSEPRTVCPPRLAISTTPGENLVRVHVIPARRDRHRNPGLVALRYDSALPRPAPATAPARNPPSTPAPTCSASSDIYHRVHLALWTRTLCAMLSYCINGLSSGLRNAGRPPCSRVQRPQGRAPIASRAAAKRTYPCYSARKLDPSESRNLKGL